MPMQQLQCFGDDRNNGHCVDGDVVAANSHPNVETASGLLYDPEVRGGRWLRRDAQPIQGVQLIGL
jgi:hypothetical protein